MPEQRANAVTREPELQSFWEEERIYERLSEENAGEKFVLHDGPPYANGDLHMGHALNKVMEMVYYFLAPIPASFMSFRVSILFRTTEVTTGSRIGYQHRAAVWGKRVNGVCKNAGS